MMGLLRGVARTAVVAGTATAVSNRVSRRQGGRWAQQEAAAQPAQAPPPAAAPAPAPQTPQAPSMDDKLAQLKDLGDLKESGVLSEAEFAAQKQKILGT
ncbi:SHOCT domain-containing protein [Catenulispora acidiphila]